MNLRERVYERDGGQCIYCGKVIELGEMHLEHKIPRVFGGTNEETNLLCSCKECNFEKSSKLMVRSEDMLSASDNIRLKEEVERLRSESSKYKRRMDVASAAIGLVASYSYGDDEGTSDFYKQLGDLIKDNPWLSK